MSVRFRLFARIALAASAGLMALTLAEVALRWFDPFGISYHLSVGRFLDPDHGAVRRDETALKYVLRPSYDYDDAFVAHTNALGLRGPETSREKPADVFRVLVLGDSVTYGLGVDDGACFVDHLRAEFASSSSPSIEFLNAGCPGYNGVDEALFLMHYGLALEPDLVIIFYVPDDPPRNLSAQDRDAKADRRTSFWYRFFHESERFHSLYLKQLAKHLYWVTLQRQGQLEEVFDVGGSGIDAVAKEGYLTVLREICQLCASQDAQFAVSASADETYLSSFCEKEGLPFLACGLEMGVVPADLRLSAVDAHPNEKGHRLIADHLIRALRRERLLP